MRSRTLKASIGCTGIGLHSGAKVTMVLHPAEPGTGIRFRRVDINGGGAIIPAIWSAVHDTRMNSCLRNEDGVVVGTVEHLMSALAGMRIDNCLIDINGPEVPVMDGSAAPFLFLIECAGVVEQSAPRQAIKVLKQVTVQDGDRIASLTPFDGFSLRFEIDFAHPAVDSTGQCVEFDMGEDNYTRDIARARTFGFTKDVEMLRSHGLALGGGMDNAIVMDDYKVLNSDGLRYDDEFAKHKILDAIGDLYLIGRPLLAAYSAFRSGHGMNNQLLRALLAQPDAWEMVSFDSERQAPKGFAQPARAW